MNAKDSTFLYYIHKLHLQVIFHFFLNMSNVSSSQVQQVFLALERTAKMDNAVRQETPESQEPPVQEGLQGLRGFVILRPVSAGLFPRSTWSVERSPPATENHETSPLRHTPDLILQWPGLLQKKAPQSLHLNCGAKGNRDKAQL